MKKISFKEWLLFLLLAAVFFGVWYKWESRHFVSSRLTVDKEEAVAQARNFLKKKGVDIDTYNLCVTFESDYQADSYLQKTLGLKRNDAFVAEHAYDIFFWQIRFFQEFNKEEFLIRVSPDNAEIIEYNHLIEDVESRQSKEKDEARAEAEKFLKENFGINLSNYDFHEEKTKRFENRTDYSFSWEKKGIYIPWKQGEGGAILLTGATVSGDEIRSFYKNYLDIPESFNRYIQHQSILGGYLYSFYFILFLGLLGAAIYAITRRMNTVTIRESKKWYYILGIFFAGINIAFILNNLNSVIMAYPTSARISFFIGQYLTNAVILTAFLAVGSIVPGLAAESLWGEVAAQRKNLSFLFYVKGTFLSRHVSNLILLGYIVFIIMLGFQASIFYVGQRYVGVWRQWHRLTQFSSAYIPVLSAFAIGVIASLREELIFRSFGISIFKKYFKNLAVAALFSSFIWGLGHTEYAIYPVWFRAIEVSLLGFLLSFMYLKYGLIVVLVAHYLFDVFWGTAPYLLGHSVPALFASSVFVLCLPLLFAVSAFLINRKPRETSLELSLNDTEKFNLALLVTYIEDQKARGRDASEVKKELLNHHWDPYLIDSAVNKVLGKG